MVLRVDTPSLRSAASDMYDAGDKVVGVAGDLDNFGSVADTNLQAGIEALVAAWGSALDVLAEDIHYLSGRTDGAANDYDGTDNGLANGFGGRAVL